MPASHVGVLAPHISGIISVVEFADSTVRCDRKTLEEGGDLSTWFHSVSRSGIDCRFDRGDGEVGLPGLLIATPILFSSTSMAR